MSIVKFPSNAADEPDCRFCGLCGRRVQPLDASGEGFGPCIEGVETVIDCGDVRRSVVNAHTFAEALEKPLNPEWQAFIARLGIPAALVAEWVAKGKRVAAIKEFVARGKYEGMGGALFMPALADWLDGGDADEKILVLLDELRVHLDPTEGGTRLLTLIQLADWYERLGKRGAEILSEMPDFEPAE